MVIYSGLQQTFGLWNKISSKSENFQEYNFWPFRCERQISKIFIYIYMKFDNQIQLYNNFKHFLITWQKKKCWFVQFPACCGNSSMLQYDGKAYIYGFLMIFKKLFEIFHCQKNRRGWKRIAGSVHCKKKNQREI